MQQNQNTINKIAQEETAEAEDEGIGVGSSKQSKIIIIVLVTILVSGVIYFLFLREPPESKTTTPTGQIVVTGGGEQPARVAGVDYNATDILDVLPTDSFLAPKTQDSVPALPELPQLPEEIKQQIAAGTGKKEETFTKEEVDRLIETKMKEMLEQQMSTLATQQAQQQRQPAGVPITPPTTQPQQIKVEDLYSTDLKVQVSPDKQGMTESEILAQQQKQESENLEKIQRTRALQERRAAPLFKMSAGSGPSNSMPQDSESIILSFTDNKFNIESKAPDVIPTQVADLTRVILQGKVISAVLETAIDTDQASTVRAVITRDIYAEEGKNILIPRGSRVVGTYNTSVAAGQTRVMINWNRIIRVDGMSLNIASIGADRLGRAGVQGDLDNKYAQQLANSFLSSVLSVGTAIAVEKLNNSTGITNTISSLTGETTTTSGKASDYALIDATQQFMDDAKSIVDNIAQQKPVIRIPQGEKIVIMVTQDVTLPVYKRSSK